MPEASLTLESISWYAKFYYLSDVCIKQAKVLHVPPSGTIQIRLMYLRLYRAPELGIWGLPDNAAVIEAEEKLAGFINPTSNLSESGNALFWMRLGGKKGGYLTSPEVVLACARWAAIQIAKRLEYLRVGYVGEGPGAEALAMRAESRRRSYEEASGVVEIDGGQFKAKKRAKSVGTGLGDPQSIVRRGGEEGGKVSNQSTHRHDQRRCESWPVGFEFRGNKGKKVDLNEKPEESEVDFSDAELVEQQQRRWEELTKELHNKKGEKVIAAEGGAGPGWKEPVGGKEGGERRGLKEQVEESIEDEVTSDDEIEDVWLAGEDKYKRTGWAIGRLDVDDNAGCVGKQNAKDACKVDVFAKHAVRGSGGPLVFIK